MNTVQILCAVWSIVTAVVSPAELSFEYLPSIALMLRRDTLKIEAANEAARAVLGEGVSGTELGSLLEGDELDRLRGKLARTESAAVSGEIAIHRSGGSDLLLGYKLRSIPGDDQRLLLIARDLSTAVSSYTRLAGFFDDSSDAIVMWDARSRVLEANSAFLKLSALDRSNLRGRPMSELMAVPAAATEEPFETVIVTVDPQLEVMVVPRLVSTDDTTVTAAVVVDRRSIERREALQRSAVQAQRLEALGRLAAGIAHEFNNMLMAALPWADLIRRKYPEDELLVRASDHIRRAVHRARDVTRQLLDFAQPRTPEPKPTDLKWLLHQQQKLLRAAVPEDITITTIVPPADILAFVDGAQIAQALLNLGLFARDAVDPDGEIRIIIEDTPPGGERAECTIAIEWTGDPLTSEQQTVLFDPFTAVEEGKGGGLGLSVAGRIVEQNRGRVIVTTSLRSTTLHVVLPQVVPVEAQPASSATELDINGCSILVIDDDVEAVAGLVPLLEARGATIHLANRTEDGLALASSAPIDIAVLDAGMSGIPVGTMVEKLRELHPALAVVVVSGWEREELGLLPAIRFLRKPYELTELLAMIRLARSEDGTS